MNREDFPILKQKLIYFDNGATTLKPQCVIDSMNEYLMEYSSNIHRGEYDIAIQSDEEYEKVREIVKKFIHCSRKEEVIFTSGTTSSMNMIVFGFMRYHLKKGDEVLLSKSEHASNILPWMILAEKIGIKIRYIPLEEDYSLSSNAISSFLTSRTRVISIAGISNVIGDIRDISSIGKLCHEKNIYFVVDGAQSVPHIPVDFISSYIDFLAFSAHKLCGPTGVGCLVGRYDLLKEMKPLFYGGGMNQFFEEDSSYEWKDIPTRFEAGTPPICEVIGMGKAISYLMGIGMDKIHSYELELKNYFLKKIKDVPNIILYNEHSKSGIISFNIDKVFSQDASIYLNHYHIAARSGNHCDKLLKDVIGTDHTVRISFYFYNTKEEIDTLIDVLKGSENIYNIII